MLKEKQSEEAKNEEEKKGDEPDDLLERNKDPQLLGRFKEAVG